ncbi:MAG: 3-phosphoserine/phosphohydroxythreonine transaminase [Oxalobacter sp.]|nr:3-phosphoserine/phosphohydroxythreonine transaminase [Oxalobacter sp.]
MKRPFNFSAGPAALPDAVLEQAAAEMLDWHGRGLSVMEMSHRSADFESILAQAESDLRDLLSVPPSYRILFIQASATALNAIIPMNLAARTGQIATIDAVHTGVWSGKSIEEARKYTHVNVAATSEPENFTRIPAPDTWQLTDDAAYVHICSNETISGTEFFFDPDTGSVPLVADMSSHILSRPVDIGKYGLIFAGAQKNMGIAGVSVVIIRDDLMGHVLPVCPSVYDFSNLARHHSMPNTPPVYAIYICGLVFQWLKKQGGVTAMEAAAIRKSALLYDCIDSSGLFVNYVEKNCRSRMNVPFFLRDETLNDAFLTGATQNSLLQLQGHRSQGGMRASLYNAMPAAGVEKLVAFMREFERAH